MKKNKLEIYTLQPTFLDPQINKREYLFILDSLEERKAVLLSYPKHKFDRKLKISRKLIFWN
jgi:hypothetical protein